MLVMYGIRGCTNSNLNLKCMHVVQLLSACFDAVHQIDCFTPSYRDISNVTLVLLKRVRLPPLGLPSDQLPRPRRSHLLQIDCRASTPHKSQVDSS